MSLNKFFCAGRLVSDPDLKQTTNGTPVATFRLACDRNYKNANGDRETDWFNVVCWRNVAEIINRDFHKGSKILIVGPLQTRTYTDKEGNKRTVTEVKADEFYYLDSFKTDHHKDDKEDDAANDFQEIDDQDAAGDLPF